MKKILSSLFGPALLVVISCQSNKTSAEAADDVALAFTTDSMELAMTAQTTADSIVKFATMADTSDLNIDINQNQ